MKPTLCASCGEPLRLLQTPANYNGRNPTIWLHVVTPDDFHDPALGLPAPKPDAGLFPAHQGHRRWCPCAECVDARADAM